MTKINSHIVNRSSRLHQAIDIAAELVALLMLLLFLSGCIPPGTDSTGQVGSPSHNATPPAANADALPPPTDTSQGVLPIDRAMRLTPDLLDKRERVPPDRDASVVGEVPKELLDKILADLATHLQVDPAAITILRAQEVVWNDGSLGCPKPGEFYTQALVNGYWVILQVEAQEYDYRASERGYFFLCEGRAELPQIPQDVPGTDPSPD